MNPIVMFLVKLLVSSGLLLMFYFALFRGKASFRASRAFLVAIPVLALVFSLVSVRGGRGYSFSSVVSTQVTTARPVAVGTDVPVSVSAPVPAPAPAVQPELAIAPYGEVETEPHSAALVAIAPVEGRLPGVAVVYVLSVAIFVVAVGRQFASLRRLRRRARRQVEGGFTVWFSPEIRSAFSVLRSIYVNEDTCGEKLAIIIRHEAQHIAHRHYVDLAVMELFTVAMWFNPLVWIARRELRSVHEFEADRGTLDTGVGMRDYMVTILEEVAGKIPVMANGLKGSIIKQRFIKMKTENKIRLRGLRATLTLPFATAVAMFFALEPATGGDVTGEMPLAAHEQSPSPVEQTPPAVMQEAVPEPTDVPVELPAGDETADAAEAVADETPLFREATPGGAIAVAATAHSIAGMSTIGAGQAPLIDRVEPQNIRTLTISVRDKRGRPVTDGDVMVGIQGSGVLLSLDQNGNRTLNVADGNMVIMMAGDRVYDLPIEGMDSLAVMLRNRRSVSYIVPDGGSDREIRLGYGSISNRNRTTSVESIDMDNTRYFADLKSYISGKISGIQFVGDQLIIRGFSSFNMGNNNDNNEALIVVDGVYMNNFAAANQAVNPQDVVNITVLKDSSAAIYGSRAANGVVIITTVGSSAEM